MNPVVAALGKTVLIRLAPAHPFVLVGAAGPAVTRTVAASIATNPVTPATRGNIAYIARRLSHAWRRRHQDFAVTVRLAAAKQPFQGLDPGVSVAVPKLGERRCGERDLAARSEWAGHAVLKPRNVGRAVALGRPLDGAAKCPRYREMASVVRVEMIIGEEAHAGSVESG